MLSPPAARMRAIVSSSGCQVSIGVLQANRHQVDALLGGDLHARQHQQTAAHDEPRSPAPAAPGGGRCDRSRRCSRARPRAPPPGAARPAPRSAGRTPPHQWRACENRLEAASSRSALDQIDLEPERNVVGHVARPPAPAAAASEYAEHFTQDGLGVLARASAPDDESSPASPTTGRAQRAWSACQRSGARWADRNRALEAAGPAASPRRSAPPPRARQPAGGDPLPARLECCVVQRSSSTRISA